MQETRVIRTPRRGIALPAYHPNQAVHDLVAWAAHTYRIKLRFLDEAWWGRTWARRGISLAIGKTVWISSREHWNRDPSWAVSVFSHELQHHLDKRDMGFLGGLRFLLRYYSPQWASIPALAAFVTLLLVGLPELAAGSFAAAVVLAFPWPSRWRCHYELRAYNRTMWAYWEYYGVVPAELKDGILNRLCGPSYWWAAWDPDKLGEIYKRGYMARFHDPLERMAFEAISQLKSN